MNEQICVGGENITEAVQVMYDMVCQSLDWGSGMFDTDEFRAVIKLAIRMGWKVPELQSDNQALASLAREFPEHYEVYQVEQRGWLPDREKVVVRDRIRRLDTR